MSTQFLTPVGRIVWGHPGKAQIKKNQRTKQPVLKNGTPVEQWVFGLAIPKAEFIAQIWPHLSNEAAKSHPNGIPADYSWKYKDGDGLDKKGKPFSSREGYAGHYVLTISTEAFAPALYKHENGSYRQMTPEELKTGDYVAVNVTIRDNGQSAGDGAGMYINPNGIVHVAYGQEIVSTGQDPDELFAGANFAIPAGASATPLMGSTPLPAGLGGTPAPALGAPMTVQQPLPAPSAPMTVQQPLPAPAHDFIHNAGMPASPQPVAGMPMMPGMPASPQPVAGMPMMPGMPASPQPVAGMPMMPGMPAGR